MSEVCGECRLQMHANYARLADLATGSHLRGRDTKGISNQDIGLARLYSYALRAHVIGAFHSTRQAIAGIRTENLLAACQLLRASESLAVLANRSMDEVGHDARALLSTFYQYSTHIGIVIDALATACELEESVILDNVRDCFLRHMEKIISGNGLHLAQDTRADEGATFVVPNLGITIVPLVYGDHHSWNVAWLRGDRSNVPIHFHDGGVEIHLGYGPVTGYTILNNAKAEVKEGYAMPIPPKSRHGFVNLGKEMHHVPFIFGSLRLGGWGVFADVTPQTVDVDSLTNEPISSSAMNGTVLLEREIERAATYNATARYPIIPVQQTDRDGIGGLELSIARVAAGGLRYNSDQFCAVSVVRGSGVLNMMSQSIDITSHDHFGIPAGMTAEIIETGEDPLVLLDAVIRRADR